MSDLDELRAAIPGVRSQVKAAQRLLRSTNQVLADFEERLAALENAQPEEAQRIHGYITSTTAVPTHSR